jgi:nitroimidazol reductase NimA-like FMN-containing flavoprotein (pyridoxamine 5'-phosphate oxidase superfamily)
MSAAPSTRTTVRRLPERGAYERDTLYAILDEALVCHVGFVSDGQPFVLPCAYARQGGRLLLHGSPGSRMLRILAGGAPVCVTVTLVDGLVLARSAFHHSMNYRSVVVLGTAAPVVDAQERLAAPAARPPPSWPGPSSSRCPSTRPPRSFAWADPRTTPRTWGCRSGPATSRSP